MNYDLGYIFSFSISSFVKLPPTLISSTHLTLLFWERFIT